MESAGLLNGAGSASSDSEDDFYVSENEASVVRPYRFLENTEPLSFVKESELKYAKKYEEMKAYLKMNQDPLEGVEAIVFLSNLTNFALTDGGLVSDDIRRAVWPLFLKLKPERNTFEPETTYKEHKEYAQVSMDVDRSIKRFPPGIPYDQRIAMQEQLTKLIMNIIIKYPQLHYYQGYHDVAITFLLVVGEPMAFRIMDKLSNNQLRHFMKPTMEETCRLLEYVYPILEQVNPELCIYLDTAEVGTMFCLSWFITWYSHNLGKFEMVTRFYDYFLACKDGLFIPLYLVVAILVHRENEIFQTDHDMAALHLLLSQLPDDLPYDQLLKDASQIYREYPPEDMTKFVTVRMVMKEKEVQSRKEANEAYHSKVRPGRNLGWLRSAIRLGSTIGRTLWRPVSAVGSCCRFRWIWLLAATSATGALVLAILAAHYAGQLQGLAHHPLLRRIKELMYYYYREYYIT